MWKRTLVVAVDHAASHSDGNDSDLDVTMSSNCYTSAAVLAETCNTIVVVADAAVHIYNDIDDRIDDDDAAADDDRNDQA